MTRKYIGQKVFGIFLIILSILFVAFAAVSNSPADKDCTVIVLTLPLGLFLLFSKRVWIV